MRYFTDFMSLNNAVVVLKQGIIRLLNSSKIEFTEAFYGKN